MLWEIWRVTRTEINWRLAFGIVASSAVLIVFSAARDVVKDFSAAIALILLVLPQFIGWLSPAKLNGGRPGFPFYLLYTRPVRTAVLVAVAMVYLTAMPAVLYLMSAFLLRMTSGYPFPLLPAAAWIAGLNVVVLAVNWSTRSRVVMILGSMVASGAWVLLANHRLNAIEIQGSYDWPPDLWPTRFDFPLTDYALIALMGLVAFGVAVAGVALQRRGDAGPAMPFLSTGFPESLVNLFRLPCPTSSATQAQVWFDLKSSGVPALAIGLLLASLTPLVFALTALVVWLRPFALMWTLLAVLALLILGTNAFGICYRQGRLYCSSFDATQAAGSAPLAGLKVIVRSVCVLAALIVLSVSIWGSVSFIAVGKGYKPLDSWVPAIAGAVAAMTGYQQVALAIVASVGLAVMVASHAALGALWIRYSRRVNLAASLLLLYGLALGLLKWSEQRGTGSEFLLGVLFGATRWIAAAAMVFTIIYLFWRGFAERFLTLRYVCGALLFSAAFAAAWVTILRAAGVQLTGMPTTSAVSWLSPAFVPLMASVLAPWSLNRIRHT
jgi:hypothetical protein